MLLQRLVDAYGPSGYEKEIRELIRREIKDHVNNVSIDKVGNLIAYKKGVLPNIMLAAHMDEIGLMVSKIDENGRLCFSRIGGFEPLVLLGQMVHVITNRGEIHGVITSKEINNSERVEKILEIKDLIVDTGLNSEELASFGIEIGTYIALDQKSRIFGNRDIIAGKALDDRVGCYILIELAKRLRKAKNEMYFVFTVEEEVGLYGAKASAYDIEPDWAIAVDVTEANDMGPNPTKIIGKGPTITIKDAGMIGNRCINGWLIDLAKKNKIPLQYDVTDGGTTDALTISISKGGIPTAVVGVAIRNIHSTISMASLNDIENTIRLLELLLKNPAKTCIPM